MKKVRVKLNKLIDANNVLSRSNFNGVRVNYLIAKISKVVDEQKETIRKLVQPSEKYMELERKKAIFLDKIKVDLHENGIMVKTYYGNFKVPESAISEYEEFSNKLYEDNREVYDEQDKKFAEADKLLDEEIEIELPVLKLTDFSDDVTPKTLRIFMDLNVLEEVD